MLVPKRMEVYPRSALVREAAVEGSYEMSIVSESGLSSDMATFIRRVAEALVPIDVYDDRAARARALKVRQDVRMELTDVFDGKVKFDDWFNRTRQNLNLHALELSQILYDSLEGLKSDEAQQLREHYGQALTRSPYK